MKYIRPGTFADRSESSPLSAERSCGVNDTCNFDADLPGFFHERRFPDSRFQKRNETDAGPPAVLSRDESRYNVFESAKRRWRHEVNDRPRTAHFPTLNPARRSRNPLSVSPAGIFSLFNACGR